MEKNYEYRTESLPKNINYLIIKNENKIVVIVNNLHEVEEWKGYD